MISDTTKPMEREQTGRGDDPGFVSLLGGIVTDFQSLLTQHLNLFKREVLDDVKKSRRAAITMGAALMVGALGVMLLSAMVVGLLAWAVPQVPWWGWAGVAGVLACLVGLAMFTAAKKLFASITPLPEETAKAIKEDIQWLKN